jgi:hypothetical protein
VVPTITKSPSAKGRVVVSDARAEEDKLLDFRREDAKREHDRIISFAEKTDEATIKSAEGMIRILLLINGGATVSLLTFVGSFASKDPLKTTAKLNAVAGSLVWFALGVVSAAVCAGFAYATHYSHVRTAYTLQRTWEHPYTLDSALSKRWRCVGRIFHIIALLAALGSLILFACGTFDVREAIGRLG